MSDFSLPIGSVLSYAGNLTNTALEELGWRYCDGSSLDPKNSQYTELFSAIGTCNGGDGISSFYIPDYRGRFIRGVDSGANYDPDANTRQSAQSGGASGDNPGSLQSCATGKPANPFEVSVNHVPSGDHYAYKGTNVDMLCPSGNNNFEANGGGDSESRPCNIYVQFIIKIYSTSTIPVGSIFILSGSNVTSKYLAKCNGTSLSIAENKYPSLQKVIGTSFGGDENEYKLPDFRGYFLRGVDNAAGNDPDTSSRTAAATGGNSGDAIGSIQGFATKLPNTAFYITLSLGSTKKTSDNALGHMNSNWVNSSVSIEFTKKGGDDESRPININVDYYILVEDGLNDSDAFPIGGVVCMPASSTLDNQYWIVCEGAILSNDTQYKALFDVISNANGGTSTQFNVPDYRGVFLRGTDSGAGIDPNASERIAAKTGGNQGDSIGSLQKYATARPVNPITGGIDHLPTEEYQNACAIWCSSVAAFNKESGSYQVSGGDNETRPVNISTKYFIRYN